MQIHLQNLEIPRPGSFLPDSADVDCDSSLRGECVDARVRAAVHTAWARRTPARRAGARGRQRGTWRGPQ